jgi:hypothetical protein
MTEAEFINIHLIPGGINSISTINVNCDVTPGTSNGVVTGITVTNKAVQGASTFEDLESVLEEVQRIKFKVGTTQYSLNIQERRSYPNSNPALSFFYFKVTPFTFNFDQASTLQQQVSISFSPFLLGRKITFSDYNPIIDNALEQRRTPSGSRIVESDRNNTAISPSNLEAILTGSATLAAVQESNYTITGWSNARYEGSKTNAKNYGGISPLLSGRTFSGAVYASQVLDSYIASQSIDTRTLQTLFNTGRQLTPTYEIASSSFGLKEILSINGTLAQIKQLDGTKPVTGSFDVNTLMKIGQEKMRVLDYYEDDSNTYLELTRGIFDTTQVAHDENKVIEVITPTFIYSYDNVLQRQTTISNAKVWVEETENIYYTDVFGAVYSGSRFNT